MEEDDFFYTSEKEHEESKKRLKEQMKKGMCGFCGTFWKKYGHNDWCKGKEGVDFFPEK